MLQATARVVRTLQDKENTTVLGLALGRLLQTMESLIDHAAHDAGSAADGGAGMPRVWLWSGHDTTIIPVLLMLGQDVTRWPPYTSSVVRPCAIACIAWHGSASALAAGYASDNGCCGRR